jgi:hypothetical protein
MLLGALLRMEADAIKLKQTSSRLGHAVEVNRDAGQILFVEQATSKQNFQPQRHTILVQVYVDVFPDTYRIVNFTWAKPDIDCVCLWIIVDLHLPPRSLRHVPVTSAPYRNSCAVTRHPLTRCPLYDDDFVVGQPVERVDHLVNQPVDRGKPLFEGVAIRLARWVPAH